MIHADIVRKLIGPINPVGESYTDEERLENLKQLCNLVESLLLDIDEVAFHKNRPEYSIKRAGDYADKFIQDEVVKQFKPDIFEKTYEPISEQNVQASDTTGSEQSDAADLQKEISELKSMLEEKEREVEELKRTHGPLELKTLENGNK